MLKRNRDEKLGQIAERFGKPITSLLCSKACVSVCVCVVQNPFRAAILKYAMLACRHFADTRRRFQSIKLRRVENIGSPRTVLLIIEEQSFDKGQQKETVRLMSHQGILWSHIDNETIEFNVESTLRFQFFDM